MREEPDFIRTCRRITLEKQMMRYKKQAIDLFTASAIIAVWDKINDANRAKLESVFERRGILGVANICFKLVK